MTLPQKVTFTILHTNDLHSNLIGLSPASDYTPFTLNDDQTRGGFARLAALIAARRKARRDQGPVLTLDGGDFSMGTAFAGAIRETGAELQLMARMGYDATTFGNHDFDLGPDGLAANIATAAAAGRVPAIIASNSDFAAQDQTLDGLRNLAGKGKIRRHLLIDRGGIRFGILGVLGKEAQVYTDGAGATTFSDPVETATEIVRHLRQVEKADVVIALSHGGMTCDKQGHFTEGEDVEIAVKVTGIDIVIGSHSHTELHQPVLAGGRAPVVQTGKHGENLGELVVTLEGGKLTVESYVLHPVDDTIMGDREIADAIDGIRQTVTDVVFASRGYSIDQPLARVSQDMPNTFTDIAASTPLANLVTDALRQATGADIAFTANGMMRAGLIRGKTGVQTVYDIFALAPLGAGIADQTAGSTLVTAWFTGAELKNILEFCLVENPAHPGEYFPRLSGLRFHHDPARPRFDTVTAIELGDFDTGYRPIGFAASDGTLYSLTCPLMLGMILTAIPAYTKGALPLVPKNSAGVALKSKAEALADPRGSTANLLAPRGRIDPDSAATAPGTGAEIKEWQAIMDYLRRIPAAVPGELPEIPLDDRAREVRAIRAA